MMIATTDTFSPEQTGFDSQALADRGDKIFLIGCFVTGTWVLGIIGAPILLYGIYLLRKAQLQGAAIRPWSITIVGGLILVDSAVNYLAWGFDHFWSHGSLIARSLWINFGMICDGGYALNYNTTPMGGVSVPAEKAVQTVSVWLVMPMKAAAAMGFLKMKRWGLQWSIISNWLYLCLWMVYATAMTLQFELRFGTSEFGVLGLWLVGGIPFIGPVILLPYLHTVNRELWSS